MSRLEIKVDGDHVGADKMLRLASLTIKMLKAIERDICKEKGIKPSVQWRVDILSGFEYGLVAIRGKPLREVTADGFQGIWDEVQRRWRAT